MLGCLGAVCCVSLHFVCGLCSKVCVLGGGGAVCTGGCVCAFLSVAECGMCVGVCLDRCVCCCLPLSPPP